MKYYLAPMEGYTGFTIRNAFNKYFPGVDCYFTPFLPMSEKLGAKYIRDLLPENNSNLKLIPQLMATSADEVKHMYSILKDYGYDTLNINLGCPSGTVTSKNRGSGFLRDTDALDRFLYETMSSDICNISIKTRIGFYEVDEWSDILDVYRKYSFDELIIHPRIQKEMYKGEPHLECYKMAYDTIDKSPLCYNGNINSKEDAEKIINTFPNTDRIMIGRGLFTNPGLVYYLKNGCYPDDYRNRLVEFHDYIYDEFLRLFSGEQDVLMHMKGIWAFLGNGFSEDEKLLKKIKKTKNPLEYKSIAHDILLNYPLSY